MDVGYSVSGCYDCDIWLPVSGYNNNNHTKDSTILSEFKFTESECRSDAVESYPCLGSLAFNGIGRVYSWSLGRSWHRLMEILHVEAIKRSEGWGLVIFGPMLVPPLVLYRQRRRHPS